MFNDLVHQDYIDWFIEYVFDEILGANVHAVKEGRHRGAVPIQIEAERFPSAPLSNS